jgi:hypothetical protein
LSEEGHTNPVAISATDITDSTHINLNVENNDGSGSPTKLNTSLDKISDSDEEHVYINLF